MAKQEKEKDASSSSPAYASRGAQDSRSSMEDSPEPTKSFAEADDSELAQVGVLPSIGSRQFLPVGADIKVFNGTAGFEGSTVTILWRSMFLVPVVQVEHCCCVCRLQTTEHVLHYASP
jgi:hypothetical protein